MRRGTIQWDTIVIWVLLLLGLLILLAVIAVSREKMLALVQKIAEALRFGA
ncbi:hypothetical protein J4439_03535 [Candidatus Woesearchaeota archaeon]|nr:hypothetical protein [Candidatus Woesearchaeota archaeon]